MQTVTELFMDLVRIDSISGEEEKIRQKIISFCSSECQLTTSIDTIGNVYIQTPGSGKPLFFCAHLDTVEPGRGIVPVLRNDILTSAGNTILGADDKGAVAALLSALQHISHTPDVTWRPLEVLFTVSEEVECLGAIHFDQSQLKANIGIIFDGSGPIETIMSASPFYARFNITLKGKSAHAGYPEKAVPITKTLLQITESIEALRSKELLVNIGTFSAGTARNTIMGKAYLEGEVRGFDASIFQAGLEKLAAVLGLSYECEVISEVVIENPGYIHTPEELNFMKGLIDSCLGTNTTFHKSFGVSDANIFNQSPNLTVYNLGDGSNYAHTTHEETSVYALERMKQLILALSDSNVQISQEE